MLYDDHETIYKQQGCSSVEIDDACISLKVGNHQSGERGSYEVTYVSEDGDSAVIIGTACYESGVYRKKFFVESKENSFILGWSSM